MSKVDFDDAREDELKEFMCLWNQATVDTAVSSLNDRIRAREIAIMFLSKYADLHNKKLKTSPENRK